MLPVAIIGAGASGLITAHTLSTDGFDVQLITRDASPGGTWAKERLYPGLFISNVHGEYRFSSHEMTVPPNALKTGGRLSGGDISRYMSEFADKFLQGKILYGTEILNIRRDEDSIWVISARNLGTGELITLRFSKVVLCTGGASRPMIPDDLSPAAAEKVRFQGPVIHSAHFAARLEEILAKSDSSKSVVVVGGGKSAQDVCSLLAKEGRNVTMVYTRTDPFISRPKPLPDFIRKSRIVSVISPHINLRTRLERFLHTTSLGSKIVQANWAGVKAGAFSSMDVPKKSPLRLTYSMFWSIQTNDDGIPTKDCFHSLVNKGVIKVIAPARMTGYAADGHSVVLDNGQIVEADMVILATGYTSSWEGIIDDKTAEDVGLHRHPAPANASELSDEWSNYTTLAKPPPLHPENARWSSSLYKGTIPAKNLLKRDFAINGSVICSNPGYAMEVAAHWISSYFLGDKMQLPSTPEAAMKHSEREAAWLRKRHPDQNLSVNESSTSFASFWTWPQHTDELLEDMYLRSRRSGGNWLTWPFKVISIDELATLHDERAANRQKAG